MVDTVNTGRELRDIPPSAVHKREGLDVCNQVPLFLTGSIYLITSFKSAVPCPYCSMSDKS